MKNESKKANAKLTSVLAAVLIIVVAIVAVIAAITETYYEKGSIYVLHQTGYAVFSICVTINDREGNN